MPYCLLDALWPWQRHFGKPNRTAFSGASFGRSTISPCPVGWIEVLQVSLAQMVTYRLFQVSSTVLLELGWVITPVQNLDPPVVSLRICIYIYICGFRVHHPEKSLAACEDKCNPQALHGSPFWGHHLQSKFLQTKRWASSLGISQILLQWLSVPTVAPILCWCMNSLVTNVSLYVTIDVYEKKHKELL